MSWEKREAMTNLVVLGEAEGHVRKCSGLLAECPFDKMYPDKMNYVIIQKSGEEVVLSGSASLGRQLIPTDIGKFVKCEFTGWGRSANGKYKVIEVNIWQGEPNAEMLKWPRYAEVQASVVPPVKLTVKGNAKPPVQQKHDDDDFGSATATQDDDSDLPF